MRLTKDEADKYQKLGATRYYVMRMYCQSCKAIAGSIVSTKDNPKPRLRDIDAAYLCRSCTALIIDNIKKHDIPFHDTAVDHFQESMK